MSNVIELRLLDHCVHPMCYVMDVMTNLRQYYSNTHKITKREDISNPFEVLERQTLEVENIDEKNKYLTILFFSQLYTHLHTCQKSHPYSFLVYCHLRCSLDGNLVKSCIVKLHPDSLVVSKLYLARRSRCMRPPNKTPVLAQ